MRNVLARLRPAKPMLVDRGQEFFPRDLDDLVSTESDRIAVALLFDGASHLARRGSLPQGQLLQDAFAAGVIRALDAPSTYLEIGGGPPRDHSNTYALDQAGWTGTVMEPNPDFADLYARHRTGKTHLRRQAVVAGERRVAPARLVSAGELSYLDGEAEPANDVWREVREEALKAGKVIEVDAIGASTLWRELESVCPPSFLSLDVEGNEVAILQSLDYVAHRPVAVCAETSSDVRRTAAMDSVMADAGYARVLAHASQWDNWYIDAASWDELRDSAGLG